MSYSSVNFAMMQWLPCSSSLQLIFRSHPDRVKPKTIRLGFVASLLSMHQQGVRAMTGCLVGNITVVACASTITIELSILV